MPRSATNVLDSYLSKPLWWRRGRAPTLKAMLRWFRPRSWEHRLRRDSILTWRRIEEQRAKYVALMNRLERRDRLLVLGLLPEIVEDQTLNLQIELVERPIQPNAPSA